MQPAVTTSNPPAAQPGATPLRVAAMMSTAEISGPGRQLVALGQELQRRGVAFELLVLTRPGAANPMRDYAASHGVACRVLVDRGPIDPQLVRDAAAFIESWRPDIVQTHSYKPTSIMYVLSRRKARCAWIGFHEGETDKGLRDWLYTRLDFRMLRAADRVVVMSQKQQAIFPAGLGHVRIVHNAVPPLAAAKDLSLLPAVLRRRRGEGPVPLVGAIGRLSREKGVDVFLDALALLRACGIAAKGIVIGEGALEESLKAQAAALGLGDEVVFTGRVEAMREAYEALDLMVIPSRSEGLPSVLLEAMPTGLPVVSTRVGAMVEIAEDEPDAIRLVPPEQPGLLADAIAAALGDLGSSAAAAARARVVAAFSIERRCDRMLELYGEALRARRSA